MTVLVFPSRPGRKSSIRPYSTYGEVAPPPVGGRRLQREIALLFHRVVEPGGKSEVPTGTPRSISSKSPRRPVVGVGIPLSDFWSRSAPVRSGRNSV